MEDLVGYLGPLGIIAVAVLGIVIFLAISFRVVVSTNDVHIVQSASKTTSYGKDEKSGNTYYRWPSWVPIIGIMVTRLPVSVFDIKLSGYDAYDKERLPFVVDIMAFFRITDAHIAAQRVQTINGLNDQLKNILQGAARSILAKSSIEDILEGRSQFGTLFTQEVDTQLKEWGVQTVKCIELMDIRDATGSQVIGNIMQKKKSMIESQSRIEVAQNIQKAQMAEIDAQRQVKTQEQDALEQIGVRTAQKDRQIGMANADKDQQIGVAAERSKQLVKEQERATVEKQMAIAEVQNVRSAEIAKKVQVVQAQQQKEVAVIQAEGQKSQTVTIAEGQLDAAKLAAEGIQANGMARAASEKALQLAPVEAQIVLAKEIGANESYQKYLLTNRQIEATQHVGMEQAKALEAANIKIIANAGDPVGGMKSVMDMFSSKGGLQLGAMFEGLANTDTGAAVLNKLGVKTPKNGDARA